ncbi:MAG TPA: hypothetical protein VGS21_07985, partial [Acidimicrobiales bacterium]|nr:hypothetical protein [Acidimicrobiales bacterium]
MRDDPAGIPGGADRGSPPEPHPDPHPDPVAERSDLSALVMDHELAAEVVIDVDEGIPPAKGSPMSGGAVKVAAIVGTQALLAGLFWVVAARVVSTSQLGTGAALYASLQFVNYLTGMGLTTTLARFGAQRGRESDRWFGWSVLVTSGASAIGTLAYLGLVSSSSTNLLRTGAGGYALFFALTAGTSIGLLVDVRLIAAQAWGWLTAKVVVIGLARFPLAFVH